MHASDQQWSLSRAVTILLALLCAALIVLDLCIQNWFEYCFWRCGLAQCHNLPGYGIGKRDNFEDLYNRVCQKQVHIYEDLCAGVCDTLDYTQIAGFVMILGGTAAVLLEIALVVALVLSVRQPVAQYSRMLSLFPFIVFGSTFIVYLVILDPQHIQVPEQKYLAKSPADYSSQTGILFGGVVIFVLSVQFIFGVLHTHKFLWRT